MLYIGFAIRDPWSCRFEQTKELVFSVSKHKTLEIGLYKDNSIVGASFGITAGKRDHTGFSFDVQLLGRSLDVQFYDNRHYNEYT